jgi:D-arabinose 1-dehydrogenase-like Zn-dependent alcohol dehydrogenase
MSMVGPGVTSRAAGDRAAIAWLGYACGECRHCIGGWETLCEAQLNSGYSVDGASRAAVRRIAGGIVIGVDIEDHKLEMAASLGADHVVNARGGDPVAAIQASGGARRRNDHQSDHVW